MREGVVLPHHVLPPSGWVGDPIRDGADVLGPIARFRLADNRAVAAQDR